VVVLERGRIAISGPADEVRGQIDAVEPAYPGAASTG
jgi:hypothetical protein